jgi:peptidoglycan/LPS O-acetylase OafA/YrhL
VTADRQAIPHISALDGARGAAIAGVLLFHAGHLRGGYLGVDFFFTLSGFLITSLLLAESGRTGRIRLGNFWSRRARRLLPALAVLMLGVALYCVTLAPADQLAQIRGDAFATLAYVANWREVFSRQNYFAIFSAPSPLNHTWSLAIEEQFYAIWPLVFVGLIAGFRRATARAVLVTSLALAGISGVLMITLYDPADVAPVYYGTHTRVASILLGAALAAWLTLRGPVKRRSARIALEVFGLAGAVVLALAWTRLDGESSTLYRGGFLVCGLAATAVLAAAVHPEPGPVSRLLSLRALCALGLISYGVYLYHWPLDIVLNEERVGLRGWPLFAVQTGVTLAVAIASYRIIEQPIRRGAWPRLRWRTLAPALAIVLVVALVASTSGARPHRVVTGPSRPIIAARSAFRAAPPGAVRVMVVGDSVAYLLGQAMKGVAKPSRVAVFNAAIEGCVFPPGIAGARYAGITHKQLLTCGPSWEAGAVARFRPGVVFWIVNGPADAVMYRGKWVDACSAQYASLYKRSLRKELAVLGSGGAKVVMPTEVYPRYYGADVDRPTDCENRLRREVAASTGTQLIDLQEFVCPAGQCRENQDGVTLRDDGEHFEGAGGRVVARWLFDQVEPIALRN